MTNNINQNRNNTNNTNRPQRTHQPLAIRRVTRSAVTQQIEALTQGENGVYAPLITQAYRAVQSNMQELIPDRMINALLSFNQYDKILHLQLAALRHGIGNQIMELGTSYAALTVHMPHQIIDENNMETLLRTPPEQRITELQMMTLGLGVPEQLKPHLRGLYNQIMTHTNNQPLDRNTINELSSLRIVDRFIHLEYILNQHRQGVMHAPVA